MERIIYSYVLAKAMYETGKDYIETFVPFVAKILSNNNNNMSISQIKQELKSTFNLDIPDHVIMNICSKGVKNQYIQQIKRQYSISSLGKAYIQTLTPIREIERRSNSLAEEFAAFYKEQEGVELSRDKALKILLDFVKSNLPSITSFIYRPTDFILPNGGDKDYKTLTKFLINVEESKPEAFSIFSDLFYGSIICTLIQTEDTQVIPSSLKDVSVFIDANTAFSMLGLHQKEINRACKELLVLLRKEECNLYIFDFTVDEMIGVLNGYSAYYNKLWGNLKVDTIYSSLRNAGKSPVDVRIIIANIEKSLKENEISVYPTDFKLSNGLMDGLDTTIMAQYKREGNQRSLNHDMLAIKSIIKMRKKLRPRKIEQCLAIFLTSDSKLVRYCLIENQHKEKGTISEAIIDRYLTQILWLKFPQNCKVPLYSAIAAHSRDLLINRGVWFKFLEIITTMQDREKITADDLSLILYCQDIEELLIPIEDPSLISEEFVQVNVDLVKAKIEERQQEADAALHHITNDLEDVSKQLVEAKEERLKLSDKVNTIEKNIELQATRKSNNMFLLTWIVIILAIAAICIYVDYLFYRYNKNYWVYIAWLPIFSLVGIKISLIDLMSSYKKYLFNKYYKRLERDLITGQTENANGSNMTMPS
jgi:predicted transcriptional regulator